MSLFGVMRTGVSGMNAQASKLGTVADNIANASTTGYKKALTEFESLVVNSGGGSYTSGGVEANTRYQISQNGTLSFTTSGLDLGLQGNGFFVVEDAGGSPALTRAGSFVPIDDGGLVNTAGYYLMGLPITNGTAAAPAANGLGGMERVDISQNQLEATPTANATLWTNLPVDTADLPAPPAAAAPAVGSYSVKTSLVVYDNLGKEVTLDVYYTKTTDTDVVPVPASIDWDVKIFDASGTVVPALQTLTMTFDSTTGQLTAPATGLTNIDLTTNLNGQDIQLDISSSTTLADGFTVAEVATDGNAPSAVEKVEFGEDGTLFAVYDNGDRRAIYRIPLADVAAPDQLTPVSGNVFLQSNNSGDLRVGFPGEAGLSELYVGALEGSNADIGTELTAMIESQRSYSANSKTFKAGSDLLQELVNLVR